MVYRKKIIDTRVNFEKISRNVKIGIIVSKWHPEITHAMLNAALIFLKSRRITNKNLRIDYVPGSFEIPLAAQWQLEQGMDAVICLGCIIKGETMHFDFICNAVAQGIKDLNIKFSKPVIFGILTPNTLKQAQQRSGGKYGNKGLDAAEAALQMLVLQGK